MPGENSRLFSFFVGNGDKKFDNIDTSTMDVDLHPDESQSSDVVKVVDHEATESSNKEAANLLETVAVWLTQYIQVKL